MRNFTLQDYIDFDKGGQVKAEYYQGEILVMAGARPNHNLAASNLFAKLDNHFYDSDYLVFQNDTRIYAGVANLMAFPDIVVVCGEMEMYDAITITNPTVLIEVLSPSTEKYDREIKLPAYSTIPTVQEVILVHSEQKKVERFLSDNGCVVYTEGRVTVWGCTFELEKLYHKIKF